MRNKIVISIIVSIIFILLLCKCIAYRQMDKLVLVENKSFHSIFYVRDDKAYIECELTLDSALERDIKIQGTFPRDEGKLLKNATIYAYDIETGVDTFHLVRGTNKFTVVFIGDYGGTFQKFDRLLPDITLIPLN